MKRIGLSAKFIILIVGMLLAAVTVLSTTLTSSNLTNLRSSLLVRSKSLASLSVKPIGDTFLIYKDSGNIRVTEALEHYSLLDDSLANLEIIDADGRRLLGLHDKPSLPVPVESAGSLSPTYDYDAQNNLARIIQPYIEDSGTHRYNIVYYVSHDSIDSAVDKAVFTSSWVSAIALLLTAVGMYLLVRVLFIGRLSHVQKLAGIISNGDINQQIVVHGNDEITDVASSVNSMANSLKADIAKLKQADELKNEFIMIASHNLRTPLTVIKGYAATLREMKIPGEAGEYLDLIEANAKRLGVLAEDMLLLSSFENGQSILQLSEVNIEPMIRLLAKEATELAKDKMIRLKLSLLGQPIPIIASAVHLRNAIWNIIDNAIKFTPSGGTVSIAGSIVGDNFELIISDTGTGISVQEQTKLFTKFHRGTSTLTYNYEGMGIGLYLVRLVIEQHGGAVAVSSQQGKGTSVALSLPLRK